jgi:hypothetical protein
MQLFPATQQMQGGQQSNESIKVISMQMTDEYMP